MPLVVRRVNPGDGLIWSQAVPSTRAGSRHSPSARPQPTHRIVILPVDPA